MSCTPWMGCRINYFQSRIAQNLTPVKSETSSTSVRADANYEFCKRASQNQLLKSLSNAVTHTCTSNHLERMRMQQINHSNNEFGS